jgi:hypothetical protein
MWPFKNRDRVVATIGYPGHGKSVFLASLFWDSFFVLSRTFHDPWQPFSVRAATEEAGRVFYGNARLLHDLVLPPANPRTKPEPAALEFRGVPSISNGQRRTIKLTFYDIAGEVFTDDSRTREYAPYVSEADDFIFLFDPTHADFNALAAAQLIDLIHRIAGKKKNLIVALTKMDEICARDEWWARMIGERWAAPSIGFGDLSYYLDQMESLSDMLRRWWLDEEREAHNLINSLPPSTRFCTLSSLGHQPVWDCAKCNAVNAASLEHCTKCKSARVGARVRLQRKPEPFRVRDPLFWIFRDAGVM